MLDRLMLLVAPLAFAFFLSVGAWEAGGAPRAALVHPAVVVEVPRAGGVAVSARAALPSHAPDGTAAAPCTHARHAAVRVS
ncbi:MAG TPA: hypothetical protein VIC56_09595 [Gemmatimonadota bacterium]|jgi:hypothetical protein